MSCHSQLILKYLGLYLRSIGGYCLPSRISAPPAFCSLSGSAVIGSLKPEYHDSLATVYKTTGELP